MTFLVETEKYRGRNLVLVRSIVKLRRIDTPLQEREFDDDNIQLPIIQNGEEFGLQQPNNNETIQDNEGKNTTCIVEDNARITIRFDDVVNRMIQHKIYRKMD
mmetsp:Transcript_3528/g.3347  ORF Transcript_3528/g.3347 Transcript_3528/m.3347 type:complete len:103 (-) Transcript_3528:24-332(-)